MFDIRHGFNVTAIKDRIPYVDYIFQGVNSLLSSGDYYL